MRPINRALSAAAIAGFMVSFGCKSKSGNHLAPTVSALSSAAPVTEMSKKLRVETSGSALSFQMDAELEKISGRAPNSLQGEVFVDFTDLEKTSGLVKVDLDKLTLSQRRRGAEGEEFGEEKTNEKQNKDARTWLQITEDGPAEERAKNRYAEFKIEKVEAVSNKDVLAMSGPERNVTATVKGDFRLHQRVVKKTVTLKLSFAFDGDRPNSMTVKTAQPFDVGLEEHDVRPRKAFAVLADKGLDALGAKVAKVAQVNLEFSAKP